MTKPIKIAYLFTSFPVATETFLQREVRALRRLGLDFKIYSLWGRARYFEGIPVYRFPKWQIITMLWRLPILWFKNSKALQEIGRFLLKRKMPSLLNAGENLLGLCFAIVYTRHFHKEHPDLFHAVWATMPATAAQLLSKFTGIPFSMGAHAYDVFEHNGDWLLPEKLSEARFVQTSSKATQRHLIALGVEPKKICFVRRGLDKFPEFKKMPSPRIPLRLLSVGRLVEKKGYFRQLESYRALQEVGIPFEARIVGRGPLRKALLEHTRSLHLADKVHWLGSLPYEEVLSQYAWAHVFVFSGMVAASGDRDGLPNVLPEAMAAGVPVVTSAVEGVLDVLEDGQNGVVIASPNLDPWVIAFDRLGRDDKFYKSICQKARKWVEEYFDAHKNSTMLYRRFFSSV